MPIRRMTMLSLAVAIALVAAPRNVPANPLLCCMIELSFDGTGQNMLLTLTLRKECLAVGAACPAVSNVKLLANSQLQSVTWTVTDEATRCVYTAPAARPQGYVKYEVEVPQKDHMCWHSTSVGHAPDAGPSDGPSKVDGGKPKDAAADARKSPPPSGGDGACTVAAGGTGSSLVTPLLLLVLGLLLARCRRDRTRSDHGAGTSLL